MANEYVVTDRTTSQKYAIKIDNGELYFETTANSAGSEPIIEDDVNASTYYQWYIDNGELQINPTSTAQDDSIVLYDATLSKNWKLVVRNGEPAYEETTIPSTQRYPICRFITTPVVVRVTPTNRITKFQQTVRVTKANIKQSITNAKVQILKMFGLGGAGTDGTVALVSADTWYQVPQSGSVPTSAYTLVVTKENEAGTIRWSFINGGTPGVDNGNKAPTHLTVDLKADQFVYFASSTGGDDVNWTAKVQ